MRSLNDKFFSVLNASAREIDRVIIALLAIIVIAVPFYSSSTSALGQAISESLLTLVVVAVIIAEFARKGSSIFFSRLDLIILMFFITACFSAACAIYRVDAIDALGLILLLYVLFRASQTQSLKDDLFLKSFLIAIIISGLIQSTIGFHQLFFLGWYKGAIPEFYLNNLLPNIRGDVLRIVGTFINPNYFAGFLNMALAITGGFALFGKSRILRLISASSTLVFFVAIVLSGSKGGLIVSAISICILLVVKDKRWILLFLVIVVLLIVVPNPIRDSVVRAVVADPYISMRPKIWNDAVLIFKENYLLGAGPNNFQYYSHKYAPATDFLLVNYSRFPRIAHNAYLHALAEYGLAGFILLSLVVLIILVKSIKKLFFDECTSTGECVIKSSILLSILSVAIHSIVDNVANNRAVLCILVIGFAALSVQRNEKASFSSRRYEIRIPFKKNLFALLMLLVVVAGFYLVQVYKPYYYEKSVESANSQLETLQKISAKQNGFESKIGVQQNLLSKFRKLKYFLGRLFNSYPGRTGVNRVIARIDRYLFKQTGDLEYFNSAIFHYQMASRALKHKSPTDSYSALMLYFDLVELGYPKTDEIISLMRELADNSVSNWPSRALYYHGYAIIERESGNPLAAKRLLMDAISLEPNFLAAYAELLNLAKLTNDEELDQWARENGLAAIERIKKGPLPEQDDLYAWQIISAPQRNP